MDEAVYRLRMADREEEFADRMRLLDEASVSYDLADADMDRRGPGFRQFVDLIEKVDLNDKLEDNMQDEGEEEKDENSRDSKDNDESKKTNSPSLGNQKSFFDTFDEN